MQSRTVNIEEEIVREGLPRLLELALVVVGLILVSPLILAAMLAIRISSSGPAIFRQRRVGKGGKTFVLFKLRTMHQFHGGGPEVTSGGDNRVTRIGKILRKTKIDELPELLNVVKGDMSLVGPRPEVPRYVDLASAKWSAVLQSRPGITDPVTVRLRNEEDLLRVSGDDPEQFYLDILQPLKLDGYVDYLQERSWRFDLEVVWWTFLAVILPSIQPTPSLSDLSTRGLGQLHFQKGVNGLRDDQGSAGYSRNGARASATHTALRGIARSGVGATRSEPVYPAQLKDAHLLGTGNLSFVSGEIWTPGVVKEGKVEKKMATDSLAINIQRPRRWRAKLLTRHSQFALDIVVLVSAFAGAYLLRFDFALAERDAQVMLYQLPFVVLLQLLLLKLVGINDFVWRYVGMAEVKTFITAALWAALPMVVLRTWLPDQFSVGRIPLSVIVVDSGLAFGGVLGLRVLRRALYERKEMRHIASRPRTVRRKPVLLIGAGRSGVMVAREIAQRVDTDLEVKGFIDDDLAKVGSMIHGVKVLGTAADIPRLVSELKIDHVVISFTEASRRDFRRILDICEQARVRVRTIPGLYELLQGSVKVSRIHEVEIEDLLGRDAVQLDEQSMRQFLAGKTVMITGAGGSIGSELAKQVARFQPNCLLLVERAEFALFSIEHELRTVDPKIPAIPLVADVGDHIRMRKIFQAHLPHVVLHAAAHKHVPMMESNPGEAIRNNVLATKLLGDLSDEFGVETFVLISTDKAVRPTSVMGASKRVAELVVRDLNQRSQTNFLAVRFGNVIGSTGSVVSIFRQQIRRGGPVTVTHPEMVRYFMTIPEAAQLVLQASAMGEGGEIFVLDMGEPVRILDLAKDTITLSGLRPFEDINIVFTGIRPGEKLFEELQTTDETIIKTRHPKIFIGRIAAYPEPKVRGALERLALLAENGWERELRNALNELLPEAQLEVSGEFALRPELTGAVLHAVGADV